MSLPFNFDKVLEELAKVTLKGGLVGKVTFSVVAITCAVTLIAWTANNIWFSFAALAVIFILSFTMLWRLINFADRNPQAALLEGAEFLVHQQIIHASKNIPSIPSNLTIPVQPEAVDERAAALELAELPDQDSVNIENNGEQK